MNLSTTVPLLHDLIRELEAAGDSSLSDVVNGTAGANDTDLEAFLRSNELWGGAGSIADQAAVSAPREIRRRVESALINLGREQMRLEVKNPRTDSWVEVFSEWQRQGI